MPYVGIDCAKSTFEVAFSAQKGSQVLKLDNTHKGFEQLLSHLPTDSHCVMEATGPYYCRLATFLYEKQIRISVVNPLVIKRFTQMRLVRAKTDKSDAVLIAQYGQLENPPLWQPTPQLLLEAAQEMTLVEQLLKQRTALLNQQDAFQQLPSQSEKAENSLKMLITQLTYQIELLEESVYQKIQVYDSALVDNLRSIPGIGAKTAAVLIMVAKGFSTFTNHRQVISYIGLAPRIYQSGSSIKGKGQICKMGTSRIRSLLYMCALKAKSCNTACKALFDRLRAKGKPVKVALIAVANKLVKQAFAIAKSGKTYQVPTVAITN
jgi:transposase